MRVKIDVLRKHLKGVFKSIQYSAFEITEYHKRNVKMNIEDNQLIDTGGLMGSVRNNKVNDNNYVVNMLSYGIMLDSRKTRPMPFAAAKPWVIRKFTGHPVRSGMSRIHFRSPNDPTGSLWVTAHPFLQSSNYKTRNEIQGIVNRNIAKAIE